MAKSKPGVRLGDTDYIQVETDVVRGQTTYKFPKDMDELLYLSVESFCFRIEDQHIVLTETPKTDVRGAITVHYRTL